MSLQGMQNVLCRGAIDRLFLAALLEAPETALATYGLTADEEAVFTTCAARSLVELAAAVEGWRRGELAPVVPLATAKARERRLALAS